MNESQQARCVIVKISVAVRRRLVATVSFCQSVGVGWALERLIRNI